MLRTASGVLLSGAVLCTAVVLAQAPAKVPEDLRFEVASLKLADPTEQGGGIRPAPGGQRYVANNATIQMMIQVAYRLKDEQVVGGPAWMSNERYDMDAKAEKQSNADEMHVMLINMLKDRLGLKFHHEQKEMARYTISVAKGEPKLTEHAAANSGEPWIDIAQEKFLHMKLKATSSQMDYLAFRLSPFLDHPVVDLTNLKGAYDFTLEYTRDLPPEFPAGAKINGEDPDTSGPTLAEALKQQLGLELKAGKGPVEVIVIDHIEKPSGN